MANRFPFLGTPGTFGEAFPEIEEALISSYETGDDVPTHRGETEPKKTHGRPQRISEPRIRCSNKRCQRGGYDIESELRKMVWSKETASEFEMNCKGDEGTPKGRKKGYSCCNTLHARLTIKYKEQVPGQDLAES
jgi:hypothetical protein